MSGRRKGRIIAFQALYSWEISSASVNELTSFSWLSPERRERLGEDGLAFPRLLVTGAIDHKDDIDALIKGHLINWDFSRLNKVDLAILRLSVYELLFQKDIAASIIIDEAIDISREYGTADSFKFINGVLDGIRKSLPDRNSAR